MKQTIKLFALVLLACTISFSTILAQTPEKMSYQAIVRDSNNELVTNQSVGMEIYIFQGTPTGVPVYDETHTPTTNINGLVNLEIGSGTIVSGTFSAIDWANGPFYIQTATDPSGGSNYTIIGTTELVSVPYALHAKTVDHIGGDNMQPFLTVSYIIALQGSFPSTGGNDPGTTLIGEIKMFAGALTPADWARCEGQLLPISQNSALFSILGTMYGGDGSTTFALPDLRGRVSLHFGQGPGLTNRPLGSSGGAE